MVAFRGIETATSLQRAGTRPELSFPKLVGRRALSLPRPLATFFPV